MSMIFGALCDDDDYMLLETFASSYGACIDELESYAARENFGVTWNEDAGEYQNEDEDEVDHFEIDDYSVCVIALERMS